MNMSEQPRQPNKPSSLKILLSLVLRSATNEFPSERDNRNKRNEPTRKTNENEISLESQKSKKYKRNWCKYCNTGQTKIVRHMITKHPETNEVKLYNCITHPNQKIQRLRRRAACLYITKQSNNVYNQQIRKNPDKGKLVTVKKCKSDASHKSHIVCPDCGGLYSKKYLDSHKSNCLKGKFLLEEAREKIYNQQVMTDPNTEKENTPGRERKSVSSASEYNKAHSDCLDFMSMSVKKISRNITTKQNFCKYCNTMQTSIIRHMVAKHPESNEVKYYLSITHPNPKIQRLRRRAACKYIIRQSNKVYNQRIKKSPDNGKLITVKKTKSESTLKSHKFCPDCGGLFTKKYLYLHKSKCLKGKFLLEEAREKVFNQQVMTNPNTEKENTSDKESISVSSASECNKAHSDCQDLISMSVKKISRNITTKQNFCKYCNTMQNRILRHMIAKHTKSNEVQFYFSITHPNPKIQRGWRRAAYMYIIRQSNKAYNQHIKKNPLNGKLISVKKTKSESTLKSHKLCSDCGGLFSKKYLYLHKSKCLKGKFLLEEARENKVYNQQVMTNPNTEKENTTEKESKLVSSASEYNKAHSDCQDLMSMSVKKIKKNITTKQNFCKYCNTMQTKIVRHMIVKHPESNEVKFYLSITHPNQKVQRSRRRAACAYIIKKSNNVYNQWIMKNSNKGKLITAKKTKSDSILKTHKVCSLCGGLFLNKFMHSHVRNCVKRKTLLGLESDLFKNI